MRQMATTNMPTTGTLGSGFESLRAQGTCLDGRKSLAGRRDAGSWYGAMPVPLSWLARWLRVWPWLLLAASLALATFAACADRHTVFPGGTDVDFVDADCYSRMTRVEEVCRHPGEVIARHTFENYPFGTRPHTTVPLDYSVWLLRGIFDLATGKEARDLAGAWISPLFGAVTILGVWLWAERERLRAAWLALLVLAASPIVAHCYQLGRPDHQSLIMACIAWALAAE